MHALRSDTVLPPCCPATFSAIEMTQKKEAVQTRIADLRVARARTSAAAELADGILEEEERKLATAMKKPNADCAKALRAFAERTNVAAPSIEHNYVSFACATQQQINMRLAKEERKEQSGWVASSQAAIIKEWGVYVELSEAVHTAAREYLAVHEDVDACKRVNRERAEVSTKLGMKPAVAWYPSNVRPRLRKWAPRCDGIRRPGAPVLKRARSDDEACVATTRVVEFMTFPAGDARAQARTTLHHCRAARRKTKGVGRADAAAEDMATDCSASDASVELDLSEAECDADDASSASSACESGSSAESSSSAERSSSAESSSSAASSTPKRRAPRQSRSTCDTETE